MSYHSIIHTTIVNINFRLIGCIDFLNANEKHEDGLIEALGGLLPEAQVEDYEEIDFANKMKKKRKRQRGQK